MKNLRRINVPGNAPEDVLFGPDGHIYTGLKDSGVILRIAPASKTVTEIAKVGGKALGLEWLPDGRLLVCNAEHGLQAVDVTSGAVEVLPIAGVHIHLANNAHVLSDGTILVSDSTSAFPLEDYPKDLIQNTSTGRLLRIAPDGTAEVLLDGLCFANGVVCLEDQNAVLVAATGTRDITRVDLGTGAVSLFATADGHPDNLSIGSDGRVWVAVPSYTNPTLAKVHGLPLALRKLVSHLPPALQPKPQKCCRVQVFDPDGTQVALHDGDTDVFHMVTGVRERGGLVAMGSIENDAIALFDLT